MTRGDKKTIGLIIVGYVSLATVIAYALFYRAPQYRVCWSPQGVLEQFCGKPNDSRDDAQHWADFGNQEYPELTHWVEPIELPREIFTNYSAWPCGDGRVGYVQESNHWTVRQSCGLND